MGPVDAEQEPELADLPMFRLPECRKAALGTFAIADRAPEQERRARQTREVHLEQTAFCTDRVAICRTGSVGTRSVSKRTYTLGAVHATSSANLAAKERWACETQANLGDESGVNQCEINGVRADAGSSDSTHFL